MKEIAVEILRRDDLLIELQQVKELEEQINNNNNNNKRTEQLLESDRIVSSLRLEVEEKSRSLREVLEEFETLRREVVLRDKRLEEVVVVVEGSDVRVEELQSLLQVTAEQLSCCRQEIDSLHRQVGESCRRNSLMEKETKMLGSKVLLLTNQLKSYQSDLQKCFSDKSELFLVALTNSASAKVSVLLLLLLFVVLIVRAIHNNNNNNTL